MNNYKVFIFICVAFSQCFCQEASNREGTPVVSCNCECSDQETTQVILQQLEDLQADLSSLEEDLKWYTASNGYQYRVTSTLLNWQDSRNICLDIGADLAVVGPKDYEKRLEISEALLKPRDIQKTWIGLSDIAEEGNWVWVDGSAATIENAHWYTDEPDNLNDQDCGAIWKESYGYLSDDSHCTNKQPALCEKLLDQP
ncbi:unnamed protein product [Clavelina lepadiformis]|uniref:C-type lectin domain-containing protein n=1 Tax=Clavelina lepadiformis TaxID=159417 RepID=A0ABP0FKS6_CLALP